MLESGSVEDALRALGEVLDDRGLRYEVVVAGGGGLLLLGLIRRATRDVDVLGFVRGTRIVTAQPLPAALAEAVRDVAAVLGLAPDWLNPGPTDLLRFGLPPGFTERLEVRRYGGLAVHLASRFDQVCFKVYAAVDQGPRSKHVEDLRRLDPSAAELRAAALWAQTHDPSEGFRMELAGALRAFGVEDADGDGA